MGNVLIACEFSGVVREAFRRRGHLAYSCDLLPAEDGSEFHVQADVTGLLDVGWDLLIAHPPCTYLTNAGARWWGGREREQAEALAFVRRILGASATRIALENPPGRINTAVRKPDQVIQPYQFGHPETKATALWLSNLPPLVETKNVYAAMQALPARERHRVHHMSPGPDRWKERSRTYLGIAEAMADQWGALL